MIFEVIIKNKEYPVISALLNHPGGKVKIELNDNHNCFVCGKENKTGLKLNFEIEDKKIKAEFIPNERLEGFKGIVHGGIVTTVLDEAMVKLAFMLGLNAVTSRISVELKQPTVVGKKYFITGEIVEEQEKIVKAKALLESEDKRLIAQAESVLVRINKKQIR